MKLKEKRLIFILCLIVLSGVMNSILFNVALSDMKQDLNVSTSMISWVIIVYTMIIAFGSITYSKLSSYFELKTLLIFGVSLFVIGSIMGSMTNQYPLVITARVIQSMGGSSFIALSMIAANQYLSNATRNLALTLIGGCLSLGTGIGFLIGGTFTYLWGWHSLFLIMVLLIFTLIEIIKVMRTDGSNNPKETQPFDFVGLISLLIFIVTFILGVKLNAFLLIVSLLAMLYLIYHGRRENIAVFVDFSIFKNKSFNKLIFISFINNASMVGIIFIFPLMAANLFKITTINVGIIIFIISFVSFLISLISKKLLRIMSNMSMIRGTLFLQLIGFIILTVVGINNFSLTILGVFVIYSSFTILSVAISIEVSKILNDNDKSMGLGIFNLINFLGMSFGPAIASRILSFNNDFIYAFLFFVIALIITNIISIFDKSNQING
ncbi:MFS transporter [Staphylococcus kloosii]|uniref:MFS transporter n=1 Tax=Staphylococcus kloosii TaxID=29384 RepID=UPI0028A33971|nr:MFS transporter [Staphylococcus kloosii]MDT3959905.1 MFS transporter [Staphylococcus kloosii]